MSITRVAIPLRIKALISRSSSAGCTPPESVVWFPLPPVVKGSLLGPGAISLPPVPAETINVETIPADSAILPLDFDIDDPDICALFTSILSESNDPVYARELEVDSLVLPFNETTVHTALLRTYLNLSRYYYSLKPIVKDAALSLKTRATAVRLYKFKKASLSLTVAGINAVIYPTRKLIAASASLTVTHYDAAIRPPKLFADKGSVVITFANAAILVPGTFSYGWSSTDGTSLGSESPIGIGYRRNIHQSLYSAAILSANGARTGSRFKNLRWYVTTAINPTYSILGMNIRLFHSSAVNASSALTPISGQSKTVVYSDSSTTEFVQAETVGVLTITFSTIFEWDGVNSIVVESCTSQNQTNYTSQGGLRRIVTGSTAVRRHSWTDSSGSSCSDTPTSTFNDQIAIQMDFS